MLCVRWRVCGLGIYLYVFCVLFAVCAYVSVVRCRGHRAFCVVMLECRGELVCGEWYVVCGVRGIGSVLGYGVFVGPGKAVHVLLHWANPCLAVVVVSIPVSVMMVCCRCVRICVCLCVFGA